MAQPAPALWGTLLTITPKSRQDPRKHCTGLYSQLASPGVVTSLPREARRNPDGVVGSNPYASLAPPRPALCCRVESCLLSRSKEVKLRASFGPATPCPVGPFGTLRTITIKRRHGLCAMQATAGTALWPSASRGVAPAQPASARPSKLRISSQKLISGPIFDPSVGRSDGVRL